VDRLTAQHKPHRELRTAKINCAHKHLVSCSTGCG
jgi:hypothetical protein